MFAVIEVADNEFVDKLFTLPPVNDNEDKSVSKGTNPKLPVNDNFFVFESRVALVKKVLYSGNVIEYVNPELFIVPPLTMIAPFNTTNSAPFSIFNSP